MEDCLFCKIAAGEIPSKKLYEDDQVVAFYDIAPQAKVHFLVIPKKHIASAAALTEADGALLGHVFAVIAKLRQGAGPRQWLPCHLQRGRGRGPDRETPALPCAGRRETAHLKLKERELLWLRLIPCMLRA